jgi:hypothetical protein
MGQDSFPDRLIGLWALIVEDERGALLAEELRRSPGRHNPRIGDDFLFDDKPFVVTRVRHEEIGRTSDGIVVTRPRVFARPKGPA